MGDLRAPQEPCDILGVFGLSRRVNEKELETIYSEFGKVTQVVIIYDQETRLSRGFAFIYYETVEEATKALNATNGMEIDGKAVRVDYSATKKPHDPTPGRYLGAKLR